MKAWLELYVLAWADVRIGSCGEYLGFFVGPTSSSFQWKAPLAKFPKRAASIGAAMANPILSAYQYNVTTFPVLTYVSQLVPPPKKIN